MKLQVNRSSKNIAKLIKLITKMNRDLSVWTVPNAYTELCIQSTNYGLLVKFLQLFTVHGSMREAFFAYNKAELSKSGNCTQMLEL